MPTLNILAMPVGTITQLLVTDDFYYNLNYAHFDIVPVKSNDIRVQNLPTRDDMLEIPITQFDTLQKSAELYTTMAQHIAHYRALSSQGLVDFLTKEILSQNFGEQMPTVFAKFPSLVTAYHNKFVSATFTLPKDKVRQVFLLRPKFVLSVLQAYFEQTFAITQANISQEKFANASFFDGTSEFRVNVTVAEVLVPMLKNSNQLSYEFVPLVFNVAGKYTPSAGYIFEMNPPKLMNESMFIIDKQLQANKSQYLTKIVNQSRIVSSSDNFSSVVQQVAATYRDSEAQRLDERFKPNPSR